MYNKIKICNILWPYVEKEALSINMSPEDLINKMLQKHYNLSTLTLYIDIIKIYKEMKNSILSNSVNNYNIYIDETLVIHLDKRYKIEFKITETYQIVLELYCSSIAKKSRKVLKETYDHMRASNILHEYNYRELTKRTVIQKRIYLKSNNKNPYWGVAKQLENQIISDFSNEILLLINFFKK